ncbi:hypothetical protein TR75_03330 [Hydrogenibacillus schlegelii]|nr:hypothetical protein TR75_03330 [Hydrogenibacillus schlegelii]
MLFPGIFATREGIAMQNLDSLGAARRSGRALLFRFRLTRRFMLTGWGFFGAAWILLGMSSEALAAGNRFSPLMLAAVHLLTVGFALHVIQGAILLMTPILFQGALFHVGLARLELGFSLFGAAGLVFQFAHAGGRSVACFGALLAPAYAILLLNLVRSIRTARRKRDALYTLWPVLWLGVTLIDGLRLAWGIVPNEKALFAHHLTAGLLGTMTALIGLLSPRLLSVFVSSRSSPFARKPRPEPWLFAGVLALVIGGDRPAPFVVGSVLFLTAYGLIAFRALQALRNRRRRELDWPIPWIVAGFLLGLPATAGWLAADWAVRSGTKEAPLFLAALLFHLMAFVATTIAAYLARILPFLRWSVRYDPAVRPEIWKTPDQVPKPRQMMPARPAMFGMAAFPAAAGLFALSVLTGQAFWAEMGAGIGVLGWSAYTAALALMERR